MPDSGRPLSALLDELADRADGLIGTQRRLDELLDTVISLGSDLSLPDVLKRVVQAACTLSRARYGALGVAGESDELSEFITVGMTATDSASAENCPAGEGVLAQLLKHPEPTRLENLGEHPSSVGLPAHHSVMCSFLNVPVRVREEVFGYLYLTEKLDGRGFNSQDEDIVVALASAAGVAIQNARLFGELQRQQRWRSATAAISEALAWDTDETAALALVTDGAVACSGALDGALLLSAVGDLTPEILTVAGVSGLAVAHEVTLENASGTSQLFHAVRAAVPLLKTTPDGLPSWLVPPDGGCTMLLPLGGSRFSSLGVLALRFDKPHVAGADMGLASTFATQAAVALALGRARRDHERLALLEDRERISQDLHDVVIQRLYATGLSLAYPAVDANEGASLVERAIDEIDASIRDLRRAIFSLRAPM